MIIKRYYAHCHLGTYVTAPTRWVLLKVRYDSTKTSEFPANPLEVCCKNCNQSWCGMLSTVRIPRPQGGG